VTQIKNTGKSKVRKRLVVVWSIRYVNNTRMFCLAGASQIIKSGGSPFSVPCETRPPQQSFNLIVYPGIYLNLIAKGERSPCVSDWGREKQTREKVNRRPLVLDLNCFFQPCWGTAAPHFISLGSNLRDLSEDQFLYPFKE
jgi:hypothetical protein